MILIKEMKIDHVQGCSFQDGGAPGPDVWDKLLQEALSALRITLVTRRSPDRSGPFVIKQLEVFLKLIPP